MSTILLPNYKFIEGDESIIKKTGESGFSYRADFVNIKILEDIEDTEQRVTLTLDESYGLKGYVVVSINKSYQLKYMTQNGMIYQCFC